MSRTNLTSGVAQPPPLRPTGSARLARPRSVPPTWLVGAALASSVLVVALTAVFLADPETNAYAAEGSALARTFVSGGVVTTALLVLGAAGALVAALRLVTPRWVPIGVLGVNGVVQALAFGLLAQGFGTLSTAGYLVGMAVPVMAVVMAVQLFRKYARLRIPVVLAGLASTVGVFLARGTFGSYLDNLAGGLADSRWTLISVLVTLATASAWAGVTIAAAANNGGLTRATAWVTRRRHVFTILAALGPLPYALIRLTWLTPWPQLGSADMGLEVRIQGLLLSSGAWLGVILTLGLIRPWSERFPRWFPGHDGKRVPPLFAIIPGASAAVMLCGAAVPMIIMFAESGSTAQVVQGALIFPAWIWGPMLALAVWGYAGHRAGETEGDPLAGRTDRAARRADTGRRAR